MHQNTTTNGRRTSSATAVRRPLRDRINAWIARNIIADDPNPEHSRLDRMDGLV